jgi:muramoyltetrapeptide carboxypeptidase
MPATVVLGESPPDPVSSEHLRRTLFEPDAARVVFDTGSTPVVPGSATGVLVGGTVSVLTMSIGTAQSCPANGGIVFLEDIGEVGFRLDNRLTQLLRTGWFDGVRGIVLGSWTDCGPDGEETVIARLRELGVPMVSGLPIGHGVPALTIPLGVEAELDADAGTLTLLTSPLR